MENNNYCFGHECKQTHFEAGEGFPVGIVPVAIAQAQSRTGGIDVSQEVSHPKLIYPIISIKSPTISFRAKYLFVIDVFDSMFVKRGDLNL